MSPNWRRSTTESRCRYRTHGAATGWRPSATSSGSTGPTGFTTGCGTRARPAIAGRSSASRRSARGPARASNLRRSEQGIRRAEPPRPAAAVTVSDLVKRYPKSPVNAVDGISFAVAPRRGVRAARPERRRQDDDRRHADDAGAADRRRRRPVAGVDVAADPVRRAPGSRSCRSAATSTARSRSAATSSSTPPTTASRRPSATRRADELLEQFGLRDRGDVKPDMFSGGQAQRVMIARALMHEPAGAVPRRADDRPRPGRAAVRLGSAARAARPRRDAVPDDPRHGRGGDARRPRRDHGPRQAARPRHARGADRARCPGSTTLELVDASRRTATAQSSGSLSESGRAAPSVERVERCTRRPRTARRRRCACACTSSGDAPRLVAPAADTARRARRCRSPASSSATPSLEDVFIHLTGRALR